MIVLAFWTLVTAFLLFWFSINDALYEKKSEHFVPGLIISIVLFQIFILLLLDKLPNAIFLALVFTLLIALFRLSIKMRKLK